MRLQRSLTDLAFLLSIFREHYISSWWLKYSSSFRYKIVPSGWLNIFAPFDHIAFKLNWHVMLYTLEV